MSPTRSEPLPVAELLARSRAAHQQYRSFQPVIVSGRLNPGNLALARQALRQAAALRDQARAQDPQRRDEAWQVDDDESLSAFYREQLSRA